MGAGSSAPYSYEDQLMRDSTSQCTKIPQEQKDAESSDIYRSLNSPNKLLECLHENDSPVYTVYDCFVRSAQRFSNKESIGCRKPAANGQAGPFVYKTYQQIFDEALGFGAGLVGCGLNKGDHVGILSPNRPEWTISAVGVYSQAMVAVTLYPTFGPKAIEFIINQAHLPAILCSKAQVKMLLEIKPKCPTLTTIVQYDPDATWGNNTDVLDNAQVAKAQELGANLVGYSALVAKGIASGVKPNPPTADDLLMIMYTSGTTGDPKGVMLTHKNLISSVAGVTSSIGGILDTDITLSYLPLAHIFESAVQVAVLSVGGRIGFYQGDVKKLVEDIQELKPTILAGVPRVFTRIYQRVMDGINSSGCIKKWYVNRAYNAQCDLVRKGQPLDPGYDAKVFSLIRGRVGLQNCRLIVSGAAPCPPYLMEFLRVVIAAKVVQGYGLTETSAGLTISHPNDPNVGHVGPPVPCTEMRLVSVPEMNYLVTDPSPRGEVQVRGPSIFKGYFKNEDATKEAINEDGWMLTGDVGRVNPNGTLSIIDRKKNIFKLSQGEYIAAEKIENIYSRCGLVAQVWVYGNSYKSFILAVVVPAAEKVVNFAKDKGWWKSEAKLGSQEFIDQYAAVVKAHYEDFCTLVKAGLDAEAKGQLNGFEKVKDVLIEYHVDANLQGFTEHNECLTPSFKLRRANLLKKYRAQLRELYTKNGEAPAADEVWPGEN